VDDNVRAPRGMPWPRRFLGQGSNHGPFRMESHFRERQLGQGGQFLGQHILTPLQGVAVQVNAFNVGGTTEIMKEIVIPRLGSIVLTVPNSRRMSLLVW
jgi:hypothetical protein